MRRFSRIARGHEGVGRATGAALACGLGLACAGAPAVAAEESLAPLDESALFADTVTVQTFKQDTASRQAPSPGEGGAPKAGDVLAEKTFTVSGSVLGHGEGLLQRAYFSSPDVAASRLGAGLIGEGHAEARLPGGFKAYTSVETDDRARARVPEIFLDGNLDERFYLRFGKQVLQWGRCQFFNPTDFVNVETKTFFQRLGNREGALGLKAHWPFGARYNAYAFANLGQASRPDSLALSLKYEAVFGGTEAAASLYTVPFRDAVDNTDWRAGLDLSTRLLGVDISAEAAWLRRARRFRIDAGPSGGLPVFGIDTLKNVAKAAIGLSRAFTVAGVPDRLLVLAEYAFNGDGTSQERLPWPEALPNQVGGSALDAGLAETLLNEAVARGLYRPNQYSRHYAAFFTTFSRFITSDIDLLFNGLANLNQSSAQLSAGLAYRNLQDFKLTAYLNGFVGPTATEYTFMGQALQVQVIAQIVF